MRAATQNSDLAGTVGINVKLVYGVSWLVGGGFAGIAGALMSLWFQGDPNLGSTANTKCFCSKYCRWFS